MPKHFTTSRQGRQADTKFTSHSQPESKPRLRLKSDRNQASSAPEVVDSDQGDYLHLPDADDYRRLSRAFHCNRSFEGCDPLDSYVRYVREWARTTPERLKEHCSHLLAIAANPVMLNVALEQIWEKHGPNVFARTELVPLREFSGVRWAELRDIGELVQSGEFERGMYRKIKIPKPSGDGERVIEVPPPNTRVVCKNLANILTPILDPDFSLLSIGSRPGYSVQTGIALASKLHRAGFRHWVVCDLRDAYGSVPRKRLADVLNKRLYGSPVLPLIEEVLDSRRKTGFPQGIAISPLCLNLFLDHMLDRWWAKQFPQTYLVRYLDDVLIACRSGKQAEACYEALSDRVRAIGMSLKESAGEAVYDLSRGQKASWLGFTLRSQDGRLRFGISPKSWDRLRMKLREKQAMVARGIYFPERDLLTIGEGRFREKSIAIKKERIPKVAADIRRIASEEGIELSAFTEQRAEKAWHEGRSTWEKAREQVASWDLSLGEG